MGLQNPDFFRFTPIELIWPENLIKQRSKRRWPWVLKIKVLRDFSETRIFEKIWYENGFFCENSNLNLQINASFVSFSLKFSLKKAKFLNSGRNFITDPCISNELIVRFKILCGKNCNFYILYIDLKKKKNLNLNKREIQKMKVWNLDNQNFWKGWPWVLKVVCPDIVWSNWWNPFQPFHPFSTLNEFFAKRVKNPAHPTYENPITLTLSSRSKKYGKVQTITFLRKSSDRTIFELDY